MICKNQSVKLAFLRLKFGCGKNRQFLSVNNYSFIKEYSFEQLDNETFFSILVNNNHITSSNNLFNKITVLHFSYSL